MSREGGTGEEEGTHFWLRDSSNDSAAPQKTDVSNTAYFEFQCPMP